MNQLPHGTILRTNEVIQFTSYILPHLTTCNTCLKGFHIPLYCQFTEFSARYEMRCERHTHIRGITSNPFNTECNTLLC